MKTKTYLLVGGHILFWILNYLYVTKGNLGWNGFSNSAGSLPIAYSYGILFNAALFYLQIFWLVPKYFITNKKAKFWLISLLCTLVATSVETYLDIIVVRRFDVHVEMNLPIAVFVISWFYHNVIFHSLYTASGFFHRFLYEYRKSEITKQALLKETHQSELKYLKAQLNPHFLFNGINSVYHLIGKNNPKAKDTLLQFSGLLRYQLYESGEARLQLERELDYVSQLIHLESIRKGGDIRLNYEVNYENAALQIAPLLLTPFIENAFKHISHHDQGEHNKIDISISEKQSTLVLEVKNTYEVSGQKNQYGGVGLTNVKRRLMLLYPEKHQLDIDKEEEYFTVRLKIDLR
ncbi:MAG: histidine kinase [Saprospiraceae bacterium]|nr:histidine kinase [Saprospiraceae bacterium]